MVGSYKSSLEKREKPIYLILNHISMIFSFDILTRKLIKEEISVGDKEKKKLRSQVLYDYILITNSIMMYLHSLACVEGVLSRKCFHAHTCLC